MAAWNSENFPAYGGKGPLLIRVGLAFGAVATVLMLLRLFVRLKINQLGGWALFWTFLAYITTVTTETLGIIAILHGIGNHVDVAIETGEITNMLFFTWLTFFFFNLAVPLGKVAVCSFLLEVESKTRPVIRWLLIFIAVFNIVVAIPQLLLTWLQCDPVDSLWNPLKQADCNHAVNVDLTYFVGAVAASTDLALAIIPAFILYPLKMDRKLKIGLSMLMATGVLAAAASIVRTWGAQYILVQDFSYQLWYLYLWGQIEEWLVIICACIPPIWPLFRPVFQRFLTQASSRLYSSSTKRTADSTTEPPSSTFERPQVSMRSRRKSWRNSLGTAHTVGDKEAGTWMELDDDVESQRIGEAI